MIPDRRCLSWSVKTHRWPRSSMNGWRKIKRRQVFLLSRSMGSIIMAAKHYSGGLEWLLKRIPVRRSLMKSAGCVLHSIRWGRLLGLRTGRPTTLSGGLRGIGRQTRSSRPSAGTRCTVHRQCRHAHGRMGLQYGDAHHWSFVRSCRSYSASRWSGEGCGAPTMTVGPDGRLSEEVAKVFGVPLK